MHESPEFLTVVLVCMMLAVGALLRQVARRLRVPYTLAVFLVGAVGGFLLRSLEMSGSMGAMLDELGSGTALSPALILLVFLPALVFESAYSMEVHSFARNFGAIAVLALPALIACTALTALLMVGLTHGSWDWGFPAAFVFGALISATDPVAVVAILREAGAPKRLGTLIEGESLLNDGTAIVMFTVLIGVLSGTASLSIHGPVLKFVWVVAGGVGVGLGLGVGVSAWLSRTFNNPLVEITLTLVLAYVAMIVAEGGLHVSGVMAVVTAGLWMSGPGRASVSPEVHHFLHQFWEMLSYLANTLIFFLVGVLIAQQVQGAMFDDLLLIVATYVGIMVIRGLVIFAFRPLMNKLADPISLGAASLMAWGGLRGAVSLALALMVSQIPEIPAELRRQVLVVTGGVVFLTLLINGSTTGLLLRKLGFDQPPLPDQLADKTARAAVLQRVRGQLKSMSQNKSLKMLRWKKVEEALEERTERLAHDIEATKEALESVDQESHAVGYWHQALGIEREAHWDAFSKGTIGADALRAMQHEIDLQLDCLGEGRFEPPASRWPAHLGLRASVARWAKRFGLSVGRMQMRRLTLLYDLARGGQLAAEKVMGALDELGDIDELARKKIRQTYLSYLLESRKRLEELRLSLPEVVEEIETRLALRIGLNIEKAGYAELLHKGVMEQSSARAALDQVDWRMHKLESRAPEMALPDTAELCRNAPLFKDLDDEAIQLVAELTREELLAPGDDLCKEGELGDSMFVIERGAVVITRKVGALKTTLGVLGTGDIVGEMALLTGAPRNATVTAVTPVVIGRITRNSFARLMQEHPKFKSQIWDEVARRQFDNFVRGLAEHSSLSQKQRLRWIDQGLHLLLSPGERRPNRGHAWAYVFLGAIQIDSQDHEAPALVALQPESELYAGEGPCECVLLKEVPQEPEEEPPPPSAPIGISPLNPGSAVV